MSHPQGEDKLQNIIPLGIKYELLNVFPLQTSQAKTNFEISNHIKTPQTWPTYIPPKV